MSLVPKHIKNLKPYVAGKTLEFVKHKYGLSKVIKLASNENPLGPSIQALVAVKDTLDLSNRYPDSSGYKLRVALSQKFNLNINNVVLGCGSEGIMSAIMRTFLRDKDELIGIENSFIGFRVLANASGKKINWVPMKNYRYDMTNIVKRINNKTKIIYLANPDNPTGTYFTEKEFFEFMKKVPKRVLVILDEAYFEYSQYIDDYPDSMNYRYDNVITLRTFSKVYGLAGFRVGYGFAHGKLIENLMKVKLPFEPSFPAQIAALAALGDIKHLKNTLKLNHDGFEFITNELNKMNITYIKSVTNFITLKFKNTNLAKKCVDYLLKEGIIVRYLGNFGFPECIRVTIGTRKENFIYINKMKKFIRLI